MLPYSQSTNYQVLPDLMHGLEVEVEGLPARLHAHFFLAGHEGGLDASDVIVPESAPKAVTLVT